MHHFLTTNIDILGYNIEHKPAESSAGGSLMYLTQDLCYTVRQDLQFYCPNNLGFIFIGVTFPNKLILVLGSINKHPSIKHFKFNNDFMNNLLDKIKKEKNNYSNWRL